MEAIQSTRFSSFCCGVYSFLHQPNLSKTEKCVIEVILLTLLSCYKLNRCYIKLSLVNILEMVFVFIEILFKILLFKGGVLIYAEHFIRYIIYAGVHQWICWRTPCCVVMGTSQLKIMRKLRLSLCQVHSRRLHNGTHVPCSLQSPHSEGIGMITSIWNFSREPFGSIRVPLRSVTPLIYIYILVVGRYRR